MAADRAPPALAISPRGSPPALKRSTASSESVGMTNNCLCRAGSSGRAAQQLGHDAFQARALECMPPSARAHGSV
ncbi:hypothetical protein ACWGIU_22545, partial [Streptomyces sp. NPDC054840]